jgi:hypothetical protein
VQGVVTAPATIVSLSRRPVSHGGRVAVASRKPRQVSLHAWAKPTAELKAISQGDRTAIPTTELKARGQGGCSSQATGETVASECNMHDKANRRSRCAWAEPTPRIVTEAPRRVRHIAE